MFLSHLKDLISADPTMRMINCFGDKSGVRNVLSTYKLGSGSCYHYAELINLLVYVYLNRNGENWPAAAHPRNVRNTALLRRKNVNENLDLPASGESGQDFAIFRLGEIVLNFAEAVFTRTAKEALDAVNQIRERAGTPVFESLSEDMLRKERQVELAFETHRYWDLVRWRMAREYLDNVRMKGLVFRYDLDNDKYIITLKNAEPVTRMLGDERFYFPINQGIIADNPKWVQNPGY